MLPGHIYAWYIITMPTRKMKPLHMLLFTWKTEHSSMSMWNTISSFRYDILSSLPTFTRHQQVFCQFLLHFRILHTFFRISITQIKIVFSLKYMRSIGPTIMLYFAIGFCFGFSITDECKDTMYHIYQLTLYTSSYL